MGRGIPVWYSALRDLDEKKNYKAEELAELADVTAAAIRKSLRTRGFKPKYRQELNRFVAYWRGKDLIAIGRKLKPKPEENEDTAKAS